MANLKHYVVQQLGRRFLHTMQILRDLALDCLVTICFCHFLLIVLFGVFYSSSLVNTKPVTCVLLLTHFTNVSGSPPGNWTILRPRGSQADITYALSSLKGARESLGEELL